MGNKLASGSCTNPEVVVNRDEPAIAQLILNRPTELNAWTYTLLAALFDALDVAASDPAVRAVVITGAGRAFCGGLYEPAW